jgi:hypothetical protein
MPGLSISAAWEESKAILTHDGRLLTTVALALIALPTAVNSLLNPGGLSTMSTPLWVDIVAIVASLIALAGQLALIRLAIGPSITVGGAIAHGMKRMPIYFLSVFLVVIGLVILAIPLVFLLQALGVPIDKATRMSANPAATAVALLYAGLIIFLGVRLILSSPVASAEPLGPIGILQRSWRLTAGHWWVLFGFVLIILVCAIVLLLAIGAAAGVVIGLLIGSVQPMSAGALILALIQSLVSAAITTLFAVMLARIYVQLTGGGRAQASVPRSGI